MSSKNFNVNHVTTRIVRLEECLHPTYYMNAMGIRGNLVTDIKAEANRRRSLFKSSTLCERDLIRNYETAEKTLFPSIWLSGYDFDIFLDW